MGKEKEEEFHKEYVEQLRQKQTQDELERQRLKQQLRQQLQQQQQQNSSSQLRPQQQQQQQAKVQQPRPQSGVPALTNKWVPPKALPSSGPQVVGQLSVVFGSEISSAQLEQMRAGIVSASMLFVSWLHCLPYAFNTFF
jgi:hypothetical protein